MIVNNVNFLEVINL